MYASLNWALNQSDELEELRDRINERYEESGDAKDSDHSSDPQDQTGGDEPDERDPESPQRTADDAAEGAKPSTEEPEHLEAEQSGAEHKEEGPESESYEDPDSEVEQLRECINEQYEAKSGDDGTGVAEATESGPSSEELDDSKNPVPEEGLRRGDDGELDPSTELENLRESTLEPKADELWEAGSEDLARESDDSGRGTANPDDDIATANQSEEQYEGSTQIETDSKEYPASYAYDSETEGTTIPSNLESTSDGAEQGSRTQEAQQNENDQLKSKSDSFESSQQAASTDEIPQRSDVNEIGGEEDQKLQTTDGRDPDLTFEGLEIEPTQNTWEPARKPDLEPGLGKEEDESPEVPKSDSTTAAAGQNLELQEKLGGRIEDVARGLSQQETEPLAGMEQNLPEPPRIQPTTGGAEGEESQAPKPELAPRELDVADYHHPTSVSMEEQRAGISPSQEGSLRIPQEANETPETGIPNQIDRRLKITEVLQVENAEVTGINEQHTPPEVVKDSIPVPLSTGQIVMKPSGTNEGETKAEGQNVNAVPENNVKPSIGELSHDSALKGEAANEQSNMVASADFQRVSDTAKQTGEIHATLVGDWHKHDAYFPVPKQRFEELTTSKLEEGKSFEIHVKIEDVGDFVTHHTESKNQTSLPYVRLHVSTTYSDKLRIGSDYKLTIDSVGDRRSLRVTDSAQGPAVRLYRGSMESAGSEERDLLSNSE